MFTFALLLAQPTLPPTPLTEAQKGAIGCIAALGIVADEQRRGVSGSDAYPPLWERGKRWAGIVGPRIMEESGQPREVIGFAIQEAVEAEQALTAKAIDPSIYRKARIAECAAIMDADLAADDIANKPLPKPVISK
jgi:hypothetical protein